MEAALDGDGRELSRRTSLGPVYVSQTTGEVQPEQGVQLKVKFRLQGGLVDAFSRATWQTAYEAHDTSLRLLYWLAVKKKGGLRRGNVAGPAKHLKKATLYWTRNPDLTDNATNRIWAMVIDEEKVPHVFDSEEKVKEALFSFERRILVPASLMSQADEVRVEVKLKWGRHSFIEKGHVSAVSDRLAIKR
ncbi:MAG TPA: hypothetical protein VMS77_09180 [Conexivisphaerales archaeon]|nr:hypothetical protein [Conexivisphaerales archaeon]